MSSKTKMSVVLPVRDGENRIVARVEALLDALQRITSDRIEIVVVDDGSRDGTQEVLDELQTTCSELRVVRHSRPRGMEAAGQTGLERATGELIFIQETDSEIQVEDLKRLLQISEDHSVVAARAESRHKPLSSALMRRLRAWGVSADLQMDAPELPEQVSCLQMVRRPHLQKLVSPRGDEIRLCGETTRFASLESR